ncbi:uncharacterized protein LOC130806527 [Amaranthus tricolor]|uniref:uncharacterized protein LOC130806527 n=1 Tax=Amaranthus tricolor TaxID=29722 RepID=UPI00258D9E27|nr:uncharacterized protein LOC130806527 [Amaranthus tricolor]
MILSRISRSISRSSRSSFLNPTIGCNGFVEKAANETGGFASRSESGLGFFNSYFSTITSGKLAVYPSFSSLSRPYFANPSFSRVFSSDAANKINYEIKEGTGENKNVLRPLSPHLPVYKPQPHSTLSILNRVSGMYLTGMLVLFHLVYLKAGAICFTHPSFYQTVFYSSKLTLVSLEVAALAFAYHFYYGIRHVMEDFSGLTILKRMIK